MLQMPLRKFQRWAEMLFCASDEHFRLFFPSLLFTKCHLAIYLKGLNTHPFTSFITSVPLTVSALTTWTELNILSKTKLKNCGKENEAGWNYHLTGRNLQKNQNLPTPIPLLPHSSSARAEGLMWPCTCPVSQPLACIYSHTSQVTICFLSSDASLLCYAFDCLRSEALMPWYWFQCCVYMTEALHPAPCIPLPPV